uniref:Uncharacterized protein n=1 Tax=Trieres chinensis TaxID=1514140 RepID=A0A7S1YZL4_TRICV|eukprot:CAMPEP_0183306776 /NCGR_PEP_ID=MMETSP0160_2-20130417/14048_1 /TAXON_ID=2839 ORGANISM="Odontella Sinensis, Strain Grunow 1884" /NCGR_SAMPLE_ID=MMETSP0160_2 /ASSEMBLY_ACC=CAM_ASM_000250 /LENGTH=288 /DNA_ID=CAMNT_0025470233 /DNA_START=13 /DNA_END=879 /DNA_ORIENTATION=+
MPRIIGRSVRVVDHGGVAIDEYAGNAATKDDTLSIATVRVSQPSAEPWLTLHYDEWICVTKGFIELHTETSEGVEGKALTVKEGETAFIAKGERFRPVFPQGGTEYVPICLPAFRPDRCIREEEEGGEVSTRLKTFHSDINSETVQDGSDSSDPKEVLYHMCQKELYESAAATGEAYFPPTFEKDGMFTHATAVPSRLITTANHFYTSTKGDWICLRLSRSALMRLGIKTVDEEAKPVGETAVGDTWDWVCPHIFGGLPTSVPGVITKIYDMKRSPDGKFLSIEGLTD